MRECHAWRRDFIAPDVTIGRDGFLQPASLPARLLLGDSGQATTEYAMILVVVAVIAVALFAVGPRALKRVFGAVTDFIINAIPGG